MTTSTTFGDLSHIDESDLAQEYADVLNRVAESGQAVIVQRSGADVAALVPLEQLQLLREMLSQREIQIPQHMLELMAKYRDEVAAQKEAEKLAAKLDWNRLVKTNPPPQEWFDGDEPKPF